MLLLEMSCLPALHEVFNVYVPLRIPQGGWGGFACGLCHTPGFSLSEDILPLTSLKIRQRLVTISLDFFLQKQTHLDGHNELQIHFVILALQNMPLKLY